MQPINQTMTVKAVNPPKEGGKSVKVTFVDDGDPHADAVVAYAGLRDGWSASDFTQGDEGSVTAEWVKTDDGGFYSLKSWKGKAGQPPQKFGGGGGAPRPQKTPGDIAVMQGCTLATASAGLVGTLVTMGAVKSSEDALNALEAVHKRLTALSKSAIQELKAVVS